jgi:hypothetical protein
LAPNEKETGQIGSNRESRSLFGRMGSPYSC